MKVERIGPYMMTNEFCDTTRDGFWKGSVRDAYSYARKMRKRYRISFHATVVQLRTHG